MFGNGMDTILAQFKASLGTGISGGEFPFVIFLHPSRVECKYQSFDSISLDIVFIHDEVSKTLSRQSCKISIGEYLAQCSDTSSLP